MKLNIEPPGRNRQRVMTCATRPTKRTGKPEAPAEAGDPELFRRLKWDELVRHGDFVADRHKGLERWEGPGGFRADAFVKPIYRRQERRPTGAKKVQ